MRQKIKVREVFCYSFHYIYKKSVLFGFFFRFTAHTFMFTENLLDCKFKKLTQYEAITMANVACHILYQTMNSAAI